MLSLPILFSNNLSAWVLSEGQSRFHKNIRKLVLRIAIVVMSFPSFGATNAQEGDIYPASLRGSSSIELGQLVLLLMPENKFSHIGWDHQADSPIIWKTRGFDTTNWADGTEHSIRNGIVRVNVLGRPSTVLRERVAELGWTVEYITSQNPKFGPEEIEISPGVPGESCFGTNYSGCDFDAPTKSLLAAGVQIREICRSAEITGERRAFFLSHPQRQPTIMMWMRDGGSGGVSASVKLLLDCQGRY